LSISRDTETRPARPPAHRGLPVAGRGRRLLVAPARALACRLARTCRVGVFHTRWLQVEEGRAGPRDFCRAPPPAARPRCATGSAPRLEASTHEACAWAARWRRRQLCGLVFAPEQDVRAKQSKSTRWTGAQGPWSRATRASSPPSSSASRAASSRLPPCPPLAPCFALSAPPTLALVFGSCVREEGAGSGRREAGGAARPLRPAHQPRCVTAPALLGCRSPALGRRVSRLLGTASRGLGPGGW